MNLKEIHTKKMENIIIKFENFLKITWIIILSVFTPVAISIYVLTFFFVLNFFIGFQTDRIINKIDFDLDKVKKGVMLFLLYFILLFTLNISLSLYHEDQLALTIPKFFTWVACYWYLVNIVRNSRQIFPDNEGLEFFYNLLTIQILDLILARFGLKKGIKNDDNKEEESEKENN